MAHLNKTMWFSPISCLSLVWQPPEPRGRVGWSVLGALNSSGLLPLGFCLAQREQSQSQVGELIGDTYLNRLNGLTHLPWPWRNSSYSHSYTLLPSCGVATGRDGGLMLGIVRKARGGMGHNHARDHASNLVGYVATCQGLGLGSGTVYFSSADVLLGLPSSSRFTICFRNVISSVKWERSSPMCSNVTGMELQAVSVIKEP